MVLCPCKGEAPLLGGSQSILQTKRSWQSSSELLWDVKSDNAKGVFKRQTQGCGMPKTFLKALSLPWVPTQPFAFLAVI